ncbi:MAG: single-stranded DNA-binding protein [Treponema sp.]|jgi:single-strand DNA-binding protein|nr:single-stranded DNA-binding protein [Treponema sp.]
MADINHVVLVGRLTRDAELKYTANGQSVCKFSIAVNRRKKSGEQWVDEANFFDVVVWGRQGESLNGYLVKGKLIGVDGELHQDRWEQDGQNRSRIEIIADNLQLLGSGPGQSGGGTALNGVVQGGSYSSSMSYTERKKDGTHDNARSTSSFSDKHSFSSGEDSFSDDIPFEDVDKEVPF